MKAAIDVKSTEGLFPDRPQKRNARATDPSPERQVESIVMNHGAPWIRLAIMRSLIDAEDIVRGFGERSSFPKMLW